MASRPDGSSAPLIPASQLALPPPAAMADRPGAPGFIMRARVPQAEAREYVHRPNSLVENKVDASAKVRAGVYAAIQWANLFLGLF